MLNCGGARTHGCLALDAFASAGHHWGGENLLFGLGGRVGLGHALWDTVRSQPLGDPDGAYADTDLLAGPTVSLHLEPEVGPPCRIMAGASFGGRVASASETPSVRTGIRTDMVVLISVMPLW